MSKHVLSVGTSFSIPELQKSATSSLNHVMTSSCTPSSSSNFQECGENPMFHLQSRWNPETHLLPVRSAWETLARNPSVSFVWRNARIWRDFGSALPFQTRLTHTKPVLLLSNEHGSRVKDQGRRQCCLKHKKFPYRPTRDVSLLSGHASYVWVFHVKTSFLPDKPQVSSLGCRRSKCRKLSLWVSRGLWTHIWCSPNQKYFHL